MNCEVGKDIDFKKGRVSTGGVCYQQGDPIYLKKKILLYSFYVDGASLIFQTDEHFNIWKSFPSSYYQHI